MAGDAAVAIALADTLFFSIDPNDARWRVGLYLLLTVAPFGVVAPFLGPAMDRIVGGHRFVLMMASVSRALLALAMALNVDSLLLFPLAFAMLVLGKTHHIAKSALVPGTVSDESGLVQANSRLSIVSSVSAGLGGIPAVLLLTIGGSPATLVFASVCFGVSAVLAFAIPPVQVAAEPADTDEKAELRSGGILLAATAMGYLRVVVGFLTLLLAFELRGGVNPGPTAPGVELGHRIRELVGSDRLDLSTGGSPAWHFGAVLVATGIGGLMGAVSSPHLRRVASEERILVGVLAGVSVVGLLGGLSGGLAGAMMVAFAVAIAGQAGKQSFDAIVQRDASTANLGRFFSRFEARFQLLWVLGAIIPVVILLPARLGFFFLAAASAFAAVSYALGGSVTTKLQVRKRFEELKSRGRQGPTDRRERSSRPPEDQDPDQSEQSTSRVRQPLRSSEGPTRPPRDA